MLKQITLFKKSHIFKNFTKLWLIWNSKFKSAIRLENKKRQANFKNLTNKQLELNYQIYPSNFKR